MNAKHKNLIWGAIALAGLGFLLMGNNLMPSAPQANYAPPQSPDQTPGMIQWGR